MIGQRSRITETDVCEVIKKNKQYPTMPVEEIGLFIGISGSSVRKILSQYNYTKLHPEIKHPVYAGICDNLFAIICKQAGVPLENCKEDSPEKPSFQAAAAKADDERENESLFLQKLLTTMENLTSKIDEVNKNLEDIKTIVINNERTFYTPNMDSMARLLSNIDKGINNGFDSLKCTIKKNGGRY